MQAPCYLISDHSPVASHICICQKCRYNHTKSHTQIHMPAHRHTHPHTCTQDLLPVQDLLQRSHLPEAHIIIFSHPGACPSLQEYSASFYEVQGFDCTSITSYVRGFFQATPSAADRMLSQLETRPDLMGGAYIPMNTFILCSIFDLKSASFPATMTACYKAFVHQTITRECSKKGRDLSLDPLFWYDFLPEDIRCLLASLGVLSFKDLCQVPPMFIFSEYGSTPSEPSICSTFPQELLPPSAPIDEYLFAPHSLKQQKAATPHTQWASVAGTTLSFSYSATRFTQQAFPY